jgi:hypothetical protein
MELHTQINGILLIVKNLNIIIFFKKKKNNNFIYL